MRLSSRHPTGGSSLAPMRWSGREPVAGIAHRLSAHGSVPPLDEIACAVRVLHVRSAADNRPRNHGAASDRLGIEHSTGEHLALSTAQENRPHWQGQSLGWRGSLRRG